MIAVGTSSYAVNSAAIALAGVVQLAVGTSLVTAQAPSAAFPANVTKGNVLLAMMDWAIASGSVSSVTDSLGNTYSRIGLVQGSGRSQTVWGCISIASGPCTVTFNTDSSRGYFLSFMEVTGYQLLLDSPIVYSNGPATTTPSTGIYPVTQAPDLLIATLRGGNVSTTPTGWSGQYSTNHALQYLAPGATGNYQASWTTTSVQYVTMIFGLVVTAPAPSGPPGPPTYAQGTPFISTLRIALLNIWERWPYRLIQDYNGNLYTAQQLLNNPNPGTKALMQQMVEYCPELGTIVWVKNGVRWYTLYTVTNQTRNPAFAVL